MKMWEELASMEYSAALRIAHYAIRLLRHRFRVNLGAGIGLRIEGLSGEPSSEEERIATGLLRSIEEKEGKRITDLDPKVAERYIVELADVVSARTDGELKYDKRKAREILKQMRGG
ncbi:MAG: hypothetical protein ACJ79H_15645 [Myxococcales bacterium]